MKKAKDDLEKVNSDGNPENSNIKNAFNEIFLIKKEEQSQ